ncbi:proliferation marker protein Ki-67 [Rhea pennata]|uniref:proliferation marker protein Ki-67 n=1 Tax=Rhea pennata TaxID=8795 RepID=UPI002E271E6A
MPLFGEIVVIKRNGTDGIHFPLTASSCLFGRKTECDIRIQLPQVSKEHCKIEVNENKEAILTNLSTVNPTQLNGGCFQQPVPLKHGDVLTIIDRSFRFEYPPQSTPRKRRSRSPKNETLQVLHVQQVAEPELLHKQTSGSKSLHDSDNTECEEQNANENKRSTEENISKVLPIKLLTSKPLYRIQSSKKENEMSPFSKLYETLKHEIEVKKTLQEGNVSQQAKKEDGKSALLESSAQISSSDYAYGLGSLTKETDLSETIEEYKVRQEVVGSKFNLITAAGSTDKKSFTRSPRTSASNEMSRDIGKKIRLQDHKEQNMSGKSEGIEVTTKPNENTDGNAACSPKPCSIECLGYGDKIKTYSSAKKPEQLAPTTAVTNATSMTSVSEIDKCILSTPRSTRRSPRSRSVSSTKETSGKGSVNSDTPISQHNVLLEHKTFSEISAEPQKEDLVCRNDSLKQLHLAENTCLKQRRNSKQHTPGKSIKEVLKEICDQANFVQRDSETPASSSNSKSPKRNIRRSKELSNRNVYSETPLSEELTPDLASPASQKSSPGRKRGRPRTSGLLTKKALEADAVQNHQDKAIDGKDSGTKEELTTKTNQQKLDLEDARPHRLSSKRKSRSAVILKEDEVVSETNISSLLAEEEESGNRRRASQKRRSGNLLLQPLGKRKRVSFGGHLSPELFDKSLPPNSPLKRGAIPARLSLPFGNSPRAVLKKAQGLKHFAVQVLPECLPKEKVSPKNLMTRRSPAASPLSGKATPKFTLSSPTPYTKGRFSISHVTTPSPAAEEQNAVAKDVNTQEKNDTQVKTPNSSHVNQDDKTTANKLTKHAQLALKSTPMKRRSGAVAVLNAKRRSGASSANLLVAKSWAEVVKLGVARPQAKAIKKSVQKGRSAKRITKSPKTPERKVKGHFSTGHVESPATIVVGRAYTTTVRMAGQVPKVVKNPILKQNMDTDESFTGMTEMFQTPENKSGKRLPLFTVQKTDFTPTCSAVEVSELHTPEESGEMIVSPLSSSDASEQKQDSQDICHFLRDEEFVVDAISTNTPEKKETMLEENVDMDSLLINPEKCTPWVKLGIKSTTPKQKPEPVEALSGVKQLLRTPKQKLEPAEALSGVKQLLRTPKQKPEPAEAEALSGVKQLLRTPKQKPEPAEALSGVKQLLRTPKQKPEPAEALSGVKQLLRTPKQKPEPVEAEALSGVKQLLRTPKQKPEPAEALSGVKQLLRTPKQKPEPAEALSGVKQLLRTPKQKPEPVEAEALSGVKQLLRTPKQKPEPVEAEALSGVKQLLRTPKQKPEPVEAEALSGVKQLLRTPKQKPEPVEALSGVKQLLRTPKQKPEPAEALSGVKQLLRTPKQKPEPAEALSGVKQLLRTPKQKPEPAEALSGVKQLLRTPKQKPEPAEAEALSGVKQLLRTPKQKPEAITDENASRRLLKTPVEAVKDMAGVKLIRKTPKVKYQPVEDMIGVSRIFKTPKEKVEPVEDIFGISRLVRTPREKYHPVEDFVGLKRLMAEPREKCSDFEVEYVGVKEMFDVPEEVKVRSINITDLQQEDTVLPCTNSSHESEDKGNISEGGDSQQMVSPSKDQSTKRQKRGRPRKTVHAISVKQCGKNLEEDVNLKELQTLEIKSPQEGMDVVNASVSAAKNLRRGKRTNRCIEEEIVSVHIDREKAETVSFVELCGAAQRPRRGKKNEPKELKHQSLECCGKDSSVLQKEPANIKQTLQEKMSRGEKKVEITEPVIPSKRIRRGKNVQVKQSPSEELHGTARKLCKDSSARIMQEEQTFDKGITETALAENSEIGAEPEIKVVEKRGKSLRNARKHLIETKTEICRMAPENMQKVQDTKETSAETVTEAQSHMQSERKVCQGDESENAQENAAESSQRLKSQSAFGETTKAPAAVLYLETTRSTVQETSRTRSRRVKKDSLEIKADEFVRDVNSLKVIVPKLKSETVLVESSVKDSLGSPIVKDMNDTAATAVPAADNDKVAHSCQKQTENEEVLKPQQIGILQESQTQINGTTFRRGRGKKVNFELEEANSKALEGKSLPGDDKGITYKGGQHDTLENTSSQIRRSRRKQVDSIPPTACSSFTKKQTLIEDHSKNETFVEDPALEATLSSTEENPLRWGKRGEVAVASQTTSSVSIRKKRGLLEGDDKKMTVKEDQNMALGNKTSQAKSNAAAKDKRKKIDPAAEAKSSSSLQRKRGLSETDDKEESSNQEQNIPLETMSPAKEKPLGRGRRKETALMSHTTNYISLRGRRGVLADSGREDILKEDQNVLLETVASSVKETQLRKGRRKEVALLLEATSSTSIQGKQSVLKENSGKNTYGEAEKLILENSTSPQKMDLSKRNLRQKANVTSLAVRSTSPQGKNMLCPKT